MVTTVMLIIALVVSGVTKAQSGRPPTNFALDQLRKIVLPKIPTTSLVRDFVQDDLFLSKWLKSNAMDVNRSALKLLNHIRWRELNGIDEISDSLPRCTRMEEEYPFFVGQEDKFGRPLGEFWGSRWDLRKAIVTGRRKELTSWVRRIPELLQRQLYSQRAKGKNVTHAVMIIDLEGYNLQQTCGSCLHLITYWFRDWDNYPDLCNIYIINASASTQAIITLLRTAFKSKAVDELQVFTGEWTWKPYFDQIIDRNQRSERCGGTLRLDCSETEPL